MNAYIATEYGALNSQPVFDAFRAGISLHGDNICDDYRNADVIIIWSFLFTGRMAGNKTLWDYARKKQIPVVIIEVGALKRGESWKVGIDGINNTATWIDPFQENRLQNKFGIIPSHFKTEGEFITIFGQRPDSQQWAGMPDLSDWMTSIIEEVRLWSDFPIVVRPHPRDKLTDWSFLNKFSELYFDMPQPMEGTYDSFNHIDILARTALAVNYSSGPSIQAALMGVPVLCSHDSLAWDISIKSAQFINKWIPPSDEEINNWSQMISHTEWFVDEMSDGTVWKHLREKLCDYD